MSAVGNENTYLPVADYGLLSDCHSTALVSRNGSIDWACLRRFDSGSAFARLLDFHKGGYFSIQPDHDVIERSRRYLPETMVLETTLVTETGTVILTDAFAMRQGGSSDPRGQLLRMIECVDGTIDLVIELKPRFDYGGVRPWVSEHEPGLFTAVGGDDAIVVATDLNVSVGDDFDLTGTTHLSSGNTGVITLVAQPSHLVDIGDVNAIHVHQRMNETVDWWRRWSENTMTDGPYGSHLSRSAMVLKSLCCAPTGAIIAAPTTSLPEVVGGSSNWDYRYCWIRDSTMTLDALAHVGHEEVAQGLRDFIFRSAAGHGDDLQIMYGPYGERRLTEFELDLEGWRNSRPVRIGNQASGQLQLDVYGHLLDAAHLWQQRQGDMTHDEWRFLTSIVDQAADRWAEPDSSLWEFRGPPRHFISSKVMVWVALDRGIRLAEDHGLGGADVDRWRQARAEVRTFVENEGLDPDRGNFVQYPGTESVDASLLTLPLVGFIDVDDPRMKATVDAVQADLASAEGLLSRYSGSGPEGVFLLCSCWLVQVLVLQGRHEEATNLFETILGTGNDLGLFAEEFSVESDELLGNFPQGFTHLGVIAAAKALSSQ